VDVRVVPDGTAPRRGARAVDLTLRGSCDRSPRRDRLPDHGVGVVDVEMDRERRAPDGLWPGEAHLGVFLGEHEGGAAEVELGMPDAPARLGEPEFLRRTEGASVEVDRLGGVPHPDVREELMDRHDPSITWPCPHVLDEIARIGPGRGCDGAAAGYCPGEIVASAANSRFRCG